MLSLILLSLAGWGILLSVAARNPVRGVPESLCGGCFGGGGDAPSLPTLTSPESTISNSSILTALQDLYNQYQNASVSTPSQWNTANDLYNQLANYQMSDYAYPVEDLTAAIKAQQAIASEDYIKSIKSNLASQGQLDSSYYTNLLSDYTQQQQSDYLNQYASILSANADRNYSAQQLLANLKSTAASGLSNLGSLYSNLDLTNLALPLETYGAGLTSLYGLGTSESNRQYSAAMAQYEKDLQEYNDKQSSLGNMIGSLGTLGGAAVGTWLLPGVGTALGSSLGGSLSSLAGGTASSGSSLGSLLGSSNSSSTSDLSSLLRYLNSSTGMTTPAADTSSLYSTYSRIPSLSNRYSTSYGF